MGVGNIVPAAADTNKRQAYSKRLCLQHMCVPLKLVNLFSETHLIGSVLSHSYPDHAHILLANQIALKHSRRIVCAFM